MTNATIVILGAGNMGSSLAGGLIAKNYPPEKILMTDPETEKLTQIQNQLHIRTTTDNHAAVQQADVLILAVKPQVMTQVVTEIASLVQQKKPLIISIAAGILEHSLQKWLGGQCAIVRSMPNTPALIGCGATALFANQFVTPEQHNLAESILRAVGTIVWLQDEELMDTVTALSGSGPAYFFLIIEALQVAAEELGLPADTARMLTTQTAYGAARMAMETDMDIVTLRKKVTSPGGTTEKALQTLEENHLRVILKSALIAAKNRSHELSQLFATERNT